MNKGPFKDAKKVLVFNGAKVLVAIIRSLQTSSELTGKSPQSISSACTGRYVSAGSFYYRHADDNVEVGWDDIDQLKLDEYDKLCGNIRRYYPVREMAKKKRKESEVKRIVKQQQKENEEVKENE